MTHWDPTRFARSRHGRAVVWFVRVQQNLLRPRARQQFVRWMAEPTNKQAFDAITEKWFAMKPGLRSSRAVSVRAKVRRTRKPTIFIATFLAILTALFSPQVSRQSEHLTTIDPTASVTQAVALDDGSMVRYAAGTEFKADFSATTRNIHFTRGKAEFAVTPDEHRPFKVIMPGIEVEAVGTRFTVHRHDGKSTVSVSEGVVQVRARRRDVGPSAVYIVTVTAGQHVTIPYDPSLSAEDLDRLFGEGQHSIEERLP